MQSTKSSSRDEARAASSNSTRGGAFPQASSSHREPSRRSAGSSSRRKDGRSGKKRASNPRDASASHSSSRLGNGSLSTSQNSGVTSGYGGMTSRGEGHAGKQRSLGRRLWRAVWRPTFLYCAGVPMLVPSAILTGILFAFQPFSALHAVALVLLLLSLLLIALASLLLLWLYRGRRPPSGKLLHGLQTGRSGGSGQDAVDAELGRGSPGSQGPSPTSNQDRRGSRGDVTPPTPTSSSSASLYSERDSRSRKSKHKKNKRHSKAAIPQLGRITEAVQEEEPPQPRPSALSAWGERPPRPPSTKRGHKPPAESAPPPQSQLLPLICLPRMVVTPDSASGDPAEEGRWQDVAAATAAAGGNTGTRATGAKAGARVTGGEGARLSRRHSLPDLTDDRTALVQEYLRQLAAMEGSPDPPEGNLELQMVPASTSHSERKKRGHQRSKSHGRVAAAGFVVDFGPRKSEASGSQSRETEA